MADATRSLAKITELIGELEAEAKALEARYGLASGDRPNRISPLQVAVCWAISRDEGETVTYGTIFERVATIAVKGAIPNMASVPRSLNSAIPRLIDREGDGYFLTPEGERLMQANIGLIKPPA